MRDFKLNNILVPVDFSKSSSNALATAIVISQQQGAVLTLMHVVEVTPVVIPVKGEAITLPITEMATIANARLMSLRDSLIARYGIKISSIVEAGVPAYALCKYALEKGMDMIVMGAGGGVGLKKFLVGSTAYRMVRNSPCPVLSIPSDRVVIRFGKIIFPIRNAPRMLEKFEILKPIIKQNRSSLLIAGLAGSKDAKSYKYISAVIEKLATKLKDEGIEHSSMIYFSDSISKQLLEISRVENPDLIVITAMASSSLRRFFLEYYTKNIVNKASCAVLSIRPDMAAVN
jgi:nucleotide-binding universal stress UspA family protein